MSFGKTGLEKAMGIDIQQLLDKGFHNNNTNNHNIGQQDHKINIIGNVNYENINFNFTFSKNDFPKVKLDDINSGDSYDTHKKDFGCNKKKNSSIFLMIFDIF